MGSGRNPVNPSGQGGRTAPLDQQPWRGRGVERPIGRPAARGRGRHAVKVNGQR
jgi:hypothetical protein